MQGRVLRQERIDAKWIGYALTAGALLLGSVCFAVSLKFFYIPGKIFSGGVPGFAQIITHFTDQTPLKGLLTVENLYFLINIPLLILSYVKLGKRFTIMTVLVVAISTLVANMVPEYQVSHNPLLNAVAGGVLSGIGVGGLVKRGMSSGGFDIIAIVISKATGVNVGFMSFLVNLIVIVGAGVIYQWEYALYTMIALFVSARMIDAIHTNDQRLTAFIVTEYEEAMIESIHRRVIRGVTMLDGKGAYSGDHRKIFMVVVNRYELPALQLAVAEVDVNAFVNIVPSFKVSGRYLNQEQQTSLRQELGL